ncbi:MAG: tripartite tricarboxylate transporter substrate-binding protein [Cocleimonas sp.]
MKSVKSKFAKIALLCVCSMSVFASTSSVSAGDFPERPVQTIFPWGPGNALAADQIIADAVGKNLKVPVTLIPTPGAGGTKAFKTAMARPADGYTMISGWVAPLVSAPASGKADWTYKDFQPLHSGVAAAFAIATRVGDDRFDSFKAMMTYGKAHPGELRYSSGTAGNLPHKVIAKALKAFGVVAQVVPYATDGEARKDLQAGVLDFVFVNPGAYIADKKGFKIGLILSELPKVKALFDGADNITDLDLDLGLSGLGPLGWNWWVVHKDTPAAQVAVLRAAMTKAMNDEAVIAKLSAIGWTPLAWDHDEYNEVVGAVSKQITSVGDGLIWEEEEMKKLRK